MQNVLLIVHLILALCLIVSAALLSLLAAFTADR